MKRAIEYFAEFMVYLVMTMLVCYLVLMFLSMIIKLFTRQIMTEAIKVLIETIEHDDTKAVRGRGLVQV